jgi:methionyl-tRNA formyltransferase
MNLVFAGTPQFAVPSLKALLAAGHSIRAVYTQPDRPAGRGRQLAASPVKQLALAHGLAVRQPETLADGAAALARLAPDAMIVIAYGLLLPPAVLAVPRFGCLNVHASLLPRWRGAAPIARAIEADDRVTGVCIMLLEEGLDTGPVFDCADTPIGDTETAAQLHDRLAELGATTLLETLARIERGTAQARAQYPAGACYARKLRKEEARIDWREPARTVHCKIRAFNPWPVAYTRFRGRSLRLWQVAPLAAAETTVPPAPGTIVAADARGIAVAAGDGVVTVTQVQLEGGRVLDATSFLNGQRVTCGECLGP